MSERYTPLSDTLPWSDEEREFYMCDQQWIASAEPRYKIWLDGLRATWANISKTHAILILEHATGLTTWRGPCEYQIDGYPYESAPYTLSGLVAMLARLSKDRAEEAVNNADRAFAKGMTVDNERTG